MPDLMGLFEEDRTGIYRVLRFAIPAVVAALASFGGSGAFELNAAAELRAQEQAEARRNDEANYRAYIEDNIGIRAKCDGALEAFHHHRDDERDYHRVLKACHSAGEIEEEY